MTENEVAAVKLGDLPASPSVIGGKVMWGGMTIRMKIALDMVIHNGKTYEDAFQAADGFLVAAMDHENSIDRTKVYQEKGKKDDDIQR